MINCVSALPATMQPPHPSGAPVQLPRRQRPQQATQRGAAHKLDASPGASTVLEQQQQQQLAVSTDRAFRRAGGMCTSCTQPGGGACDAVQQLQHLMDEMHSTIGEHSAHSDSQLLLQLGSMEAALSNLLRPARYFKGFHPSAQHREAAGQLCGELRALGQQLYGHAGLRQRVVAVCVRFLGSDWQQHQQQQGQQGRRQQGQQEQGQQEQRQWQAEVADGGMGMEATSGHGGSSSTNSSSNGSVDTPGAAITGRNSSRSHSSHGNKSEGSASAAATGSRGGSRSSSAGSSGSYDGTSGELGHLQEMAAALDAAVDTKAAHHLSTGVAVLQTSDVSQGSFGRMQQLLVCRQLLRSFMALPRRAAGMVKARHLSPQSVWDAQALIAALKESGMKESHAPRLWGTLLRDPEVAWANVPDLPKAAVALLESKFTRSTSKLLSVNTSAGGDTIKLLVELQDGMQVEAVVMQYDARRTLCVSSQVGCQMGCTFCATGTMGLLGNLSAGEILEQLVHARNVTPIRNVVFMGMGEPLNNYSAVKSAVLMMSDNRVFSLAMRHVTVSTVGVVPRMLQMAQDMPGVSLALSLHAPTQELRQQIVPSARAYPLPKLMAAMDTYQAASKQKVFVEYVVLADVNDGVQQAHELGALLRDRDVIINLIPWNPIYNPTGPALEAPDASRVVEFQRVLIDSYALHCTVRQEKGQDIAGACGQLVIDYKKEQQGCGQSNAVGDMEDLCRGRAVGKGRTAVAGS